MRMPGLKSRAYAMIVAMWPIVIKCYLETQGDSQAQVHVGGVKVRRLEAMEDIYI